MDLVQLFTLLAIVVLNLGTVAYIQFHLDTKTERILEGIRQEMKDFHGRLCAIEERNKK